MWCSRAEKFLFQLESTATSHPGWSVKEVFFNFSLCFFFTFFSLFLLVRFSLRATSSSALVIPGFNPIASFIAVFFAFFSKFLLARFSFLAASISDLLVAAFSWMAVCFRIKILLLFPFLFFRWDVSFTVNHGSDSLLDPASRTVVTRHGNPEPYWGRRKFYRLHETKLICHTHISFSPFMISSPVTAACWYCCIFSILDAFVK